MQHEDGGIFPAAKRGAPSHGTNSFLPHSPVRFGMVVDPELEGTDGGCQPEMVSGFTVGHPDLLIFAVRSSLCSRLRARASGTCRSGIREDLGA